MTTSYRSASKFATILVAAINAAQITPAQINLKSLRAGWVVSKAVAQETLWVLRDNYKLNVNCQ